MSEDEQRQILNRLTLNETSLFRTAVAKYLSGEQQDLDTALGYPTEIKLEDYDLLYERGDIASRIVNIYPDECWRATPEVYDSEDADDTPFQHAWRDLLDNNDLKVLYWLHRLDRLSGVGHYGILVMGFKDDDGNYHEPASGTKEITYFRVFKETQVEIPTWIEDPASPKYGWPDIYKVHMKTPKGTIATQRIHHTRILHVAEDSNDNMVHGTPRLKTVYNRLLDLRKLRGGSAEMF